MINVLLRLLIGDKLRVGLKKGLLSLPLDPDTSVICVGPGTGIAPMRAVIEERTFSGSSGESFPSLFTPPIHNVDLLLKLPVQ